MRVVDVAALGPSASAVQQVPLRVGPDQARVVIWSTYEGGLEPGKNSVEVLHPLG